MIFGDLRGHGNAVSSRKGRRRGFPSARDTDGEAGGPPITSTRSSFTILALRSRRPSLWSIGLPNMVSIKRLYELQELDWNISDVEEALADVRARLADDSAVASARNLLRDTESQLAGPVSARRQAAVELEQVEEKLKRVESRLYGGSVTNLRELEAYEEERTLLQRHRSDDEDRLLELMVEIEEIQSARAAAKKDLDRLETERSVEVSDLVEEEARLNEAVDRLQRNRTTTTSEIRPSALSTYESVRQSRGGQAVATVERGMCKGCRLALPTMELQRAKTSVEIVQCSSCRRILYTV